MPVAPPPQDLQHVLRNIAAVADRKEIVSIESVMEALGSRSFGPILLLPGLVLVSPLSGVPGVPSMMALMTTLVTVQLLIGRKRFWLPAWLLSRSVKRARFDKIMQKTWKPVCMIDRLLKPRLLWLTEGSAYYGCALLCLVVALTLPPTEMVPFAASAAGLAICSMALSLITRDGLLALFSFGTTLALLMTFGRIFLFS